MSTGLRCRPGDLLLSTPFASYLSMWALQYRWRHRRFSGSTEGLSAARRMRHVWMGSQALHAQAGHTAREARRWPEPRALQWAITALGSPVGAGAESLDLRGPSHSVSN